MKESYTDKIDIFLDLCKALSNLLTRSGFLVRDGRIVLVKALKIPPKDCFAEMDGTVTPSLNSVGTWVLWKMLEYTIFAVCRWHSKEKKKEYRRGG